MVIGGLLIFWQLIGVPTLGLLLDPAIAFPIGLCLAACGHVIMAVSETPWVFYLGLAVGSVSAICNIYINSTVSTRVSPLHQAYILNLLESIFSIAAILGSLTADNLFGWLIETKTVPVYLKGSQFLITAGCWVLAAILAVVLYFSKDQDGPLSEKSQILTINSADGQN